MPLDPPALVLEASGTFSEGRWHWTLEGHVPHGAVRIVVVTSEGQEVAARCGQERWCVYLRPTRDPRDATVCAWSASGEIVATERLLLSPWRLLSRRRRLALWLGQHTGWGPRGSVTYGPYS